MRNIRNVSGLLLLLCSGVFFLGASAQASEGVVSVKSPHSVAATADRLEQTLNEKGMTVFARINHADGAKGVGLDLRPTELVIFGNPKVGTPLMQCVQTVAIDLPQKMLIWEAEDGQVWLAYNDPKYLGKRHGIEGAQCEEVLGRIEGALGKFARAATAQ